MYCIRSGLFLITCLVLLQSARSDPSLLFPDEEEFEELCDPGTGQLTGSCKAIIFCPAAIQAIGNGQVPVLCSFKGKDPIVCCAKGGTNVATAQTTEPVTTVPTTTPSVEPNRTVGGNGVGRKNVPFLRYPGCGVRSSSPLIRTKRQVPDKRPSVAGGTPAKPYSWPWMVAIFSLVQSNVPRYHCGGSLISDQDVLTAAHCFLGSRNPRQYYVVVLAHERTEGFISHLSSIIIHENYSARTYYDDIAILRLKDRTSESKNTFSVRPVCLPSPTLARRNMDGRPVTVTGWGDTSFGGADSSILLEADLKVVSRLRCNATYAALSKLRFPKGIDSRMLCAGVPDGSKDACSGDSGGPLVLQDGVWTQVGIVSFGFRCAEARYPGVYTKVSEYLDWIARHTNIPRIAG